MALTTEDHLRCLVTAVDEKASASTVQAGREHLERPVKRSGRGAPPSRSASPWSLTKTSGPRGTTGTFAAASVAPGPQGQQAYDCRMPASPARARAARRF